MAGRPSSPSGFNAFAAGDKKYGTTGAPNVGPTSNPQGYAERGLQIKARQNAILRRMKSNGKGDSMAQLPVPGNNSPMGVI